MANNLNRSFIFFKNLFRPHRFIPPQHKKLTIFHKIVIASVLRTRKLRDIPDTVSLFEWGLIKERMKYPIFLFGVISPVFTYFLIGRPLQKYEDKRVEALEMKKFGELTRPPK